MQLRWQTWTIAGVSVLILAAAYYLLTPSPAPERPVAAITPSTPPSPVATTDASSEQRRNAQSDSADQGSIPSRLAQLAEKELSAETTIPLLQRWVSEDIAAAAAWTAKLPPGKVRSELLDVVAEAWWSKDPHAAIDWVMGLGEPNEQLRLWINMDYDRVAPDASRPEDQSGVVLDIHNRMKEDLRGTAQWVTWLPEGPDRVAAIKFLAGRWPPEDMRAAVTWVNQLPSEQERKSAFSALLPHLPVKSPKSMYPRRVSSQ